MFERRQRPIFSTFTMSIGTCYNMNTFVCILVYIRMHTYLRFSGQAHERTNTWTNLLPRVLCPHDGRSANKALVLAGPFYSLIIDLNLDVMKFPDLNFTQNLK